MNWSRWIYIFDYKKKKQIIHRFKEEEEKKIDGKLRNLCDVEMQHSTAQHSRSHLINAIKTNMIEYTYNVYANMHETPTALSENWNAPCLLFCSVSLRTTFLHLIGNFHLWSSSLSLVVNGCLMYASLFVSQHLLPLYQIKR